MSQRNSVVLWHTEQENVYDYCTNEEIGKLKMEQLEKHKPELYKELQIMDSEEAIIRMLKKLLHRSR